MKRWMLVVGVLALAAVAAHADYVVIRINLASTRDPDPISQGQLPAALQGLMRGGGPPRGGAGFPGGGGGAQFQGGGGQFQGGGPQFRGGGAQFQGGGAQFQGGGGQLQGGLGLGQGAGLQGGQGGVGPGFRPQFGPGGNAQGGPFGPGGPAGGRGPGGFAEGGPGGARRGMGGEGGGPGGRFGEGGGFGGRFGQSEDPDSTPVIATAIVEIKQGELTRNTNLGYFQVRHPWGKTKIPSPGIDPKIKSELISLKSVPDEYEEKWKSLKDDDPNRKAKLVELAEWALAHGITDNVAKDEHGRKVDGIPKIMELIAAIDPKDPAVLAFKKVQSDMSRPLDRDDAASSWGQNDRLGHLKKFQSKHYSLYTDVRVDSDANRRLERLEKTYQTFYYWFAVRGRAMPVPPYRLVAVLLSNPDAFEQKRKDIFDGALAVDDGFYVRRDNVIVLSATNLDPVYRLLREAATQMRSSNGWDYEKLLQGLGVKKATLTAQVFQWYRAQTYTLVQRYMEEESERATTAYEGTRQLLNSIGYMSRSVEVPQWIDFGFASFFTTPKGSFWQGAGTTSSPYLVNFKTWEKADESSPNRLEKDPVAALRSVVTDRDFRVIQDGPNKNRQVTKARTMAWALAYFLVQKKRDGLIQYFQELREVPRDLELDPDALMTIFARAFGLMANGNQIDENQLANLASDWYTFMRQTPLTIPEPKEEETPQTPPGQRPSFRTAPPGPGGGNN